MPKCKSAWLLDPTPLARILLLAMTVGMDGGEMPWRRGAAGAMARKLPDIHWNSNNTIFDISNTEHVKRVHLLDRVTLLCPAPAPDTTGPRQLYEHSKLFMVPRNAYEQCVLRGGERQLGVCSSPERQSSITLVFREFSPLPSAFTFRPGHSYFVITTSNGSLEGLNNTQGGLCSARNMRLKFDVLASNLDGNELLQEQQTNRENKQQPSSSNSRHHSSHAHHRQQQQQQARHSHQQPNDHKENGPSEEDQSSHPPFLYVIHTVDTPQAEGNGERTAAWGANDDDDDGGGGRGKGRGEEEREYAPASSSSIPLHSALLLLLLSLVAFFQPSLLVRYFGSVPAPGISGHRRR